MKEIKFDLDEDTFEKLERLANEEFYGNLNDAIVFVLEKYYK